MLVSTSFNVLKMYGLLLASSLSYVKILKDLDLSVKYRSSDTIESGDYFILVDQKQSFSDATLACNSLSAELFCVKRGMDLDKLYRDLNISETDGIVDQTLWTGIFKGKVSGRVYDTSNFPPLR